MTSTTSSSSYRAINDVDSTPSLNEMEQDLGYVFYLLEWHQKDDPNLAWFQNFQVFLFGSSTLYDIATFAHQRIV